MPLGRSYHSHLPALPELMPKDCENSITGAEGDRAGEPAKPGMRLAEEGQPRGHLFLLTLVILSANPVFLSA